MKSSRAEQNQYAARSAKKISGGIRLARHKAALAAFAEICTERGFDPEDLTSRSRRSKEVAQRKEVIEAMIARGFGVSKIGAVLHRDHKAISYHIKRCRS